MKTKSRPNALLAILAALAISALVLTGCSQGFSDHSTTNSSETILEQYGLAGLDARQIINSLDTVVTEQRPDTLLASVQPNELIISHFGGQSSTTLPMPEDEFYLSVAPYESQTHDCFFHSLTSCLGELRNQNVYVTVTDTAGRTILDEARTTYDNGFTGLWLPRDITGTLTLTRADKTATIPISTTSDDPTCLTTLHLT